MSSKDLPVCTITTNGTHVLHESDGQRTELRKYNYKPISRGRSIRLLKRTRNDSNCPSFDHFKLEDASLHDPDLKYTPISYVCGDSARSLPLLVRDGLETCMHLIQESAWRAIMTISTYQNLVWIDQVCINQDDNDERVEQIRFMSKIYASPKRDTTAVWLGNADEDTAKAFDLIAKLDKIMPSSVDIPMSATDAVQMPHGMLTNKIQAVYPEYGPPPQYDSAWHALGRTLGRPWFGRVWTFQEVVLADADSVSIVCGYGESPHRTTLKSMTRASMLLGDYADPSLPAIRQNRIELYFVDRVQQDCLRGNPVSLHYLLGMISDRECKEPKDKVYALQDVQRNSYPVDTIVADYRRPDGEVYADITKKIIAGGKFLQISLEASGKDEGRVKKLPSWVPDYTARILAVAIDATEPRYVLFSASRGRQWKDLLDHVSHSVSPLQLMVQGRTLDIIQSVQDAAMLDYRDGSDVYLHLRQIFPALQMWSERSSREIDTRKAMLRIARTVTADGYHAHFFCFRKFSFMRKALTTHSAPPDEDNDLRMLRMLFYTSIDDDAFDSMDAADQYWAHDFVKSATICRGRRFAMLEKYGLALVPHQTVKGDILAILHGSSTPVILRPVEGEDPYTLVGPCYVDDIMYGEAVDWEEDEADTFVLV